MRSGSNSSGRYLGWLVWMFLGIRVFSSLLFPDIVEVVEVKEKIFSHDFLSKDMIIIREDDLRQLNIKNFADLFSLVAFINVNRRGHSDGSFDLSMRGSNFEQILMLVNGIPINNPQTGHFNSSLPFSLQDVERVEIIRGGNSTTYGGNAFAGVVNIILKQESGLQFAVTGGENDFLSSRLSISRVFKNLRLRFSLQRENSSGFHPGREFDQYRITAAVSYSGDGNELEFFAGYLSNNFGAAGFYADYPSIEEIGSYLCQFIVKKKYNRIAYSFTVSYNSHDDSFTLDRTRPDFFQNRSLTEQIFLGLSGSYVTKKLRASAGIEFKSVMMDSSSMGNHIRDRWAGFLNINTIFNWGGMDLGIRNDRMPDEHTNLTYYLGVYHHILPGIIVKAGCGKSFRVPSFTELYYVSPANIGNPELKPEVSTNFETSLSVTKGRQNIGLSLFYRNQMNVIDWVKEAEGEADIEAVPWQARNIEKNDVAGFEVNYQLALSKLVAMAGVEKLFVLDHQSGLFSKYGLQFPDLSVKTCLSYRPAAWLGITAQYLYKKIFQSGQSGHFLNLVFGLYHKTFELSLRLDNILDTIIEEIPGVKIPGRWIYLTIAYLQ